jgi:hypothetical protein
LLIRIRDPMLYNPLDLGSGINPSFYVGSGIRDEKCSDPGSVMEKRSDPDPRLNIRDPQHCTHRYPYFMIWALADDITMIFTLNNIWRVF